MARRGVCLIENKQCFRDRVAIAQYPYRTALIEMNMRPDFQELHAHKEAGMESTIVMATFPIDDEPVPEQVSGADTDLLIWLQPRRSITRMLEATVRYLHGGGRVVLSVQHFNIQSRQYRGADFDVVYWPQPQTPDVDHRLPLAPKLGGTISERRQPRAMLRRAMRRSTPSPLSARRPAGRARP